MAEASLALSWLDLGLLDRAEQACSLAIEISHEARARRDECFALTTRGRVLAARGDFEEARRSMERAIELHRGLGDPWGQGHHELHLGEIELEAGHLDAACAALGRAEEYFAKTGDRRYATFAAAVLAAALASKDAVSLAEAAAARAGEGDHAPSSWEHAASFHLGHVDLARARAARARGAHDEERRHLDAAAARARRDVTESEQARLAARVLSRKMPERARAEDPTSGDVARAAADGSWLVLPDGQRLDLAGRPALKNIVAALLSARTERVGRSISPETLFAAGWPEEAARGVTAEKRVYVAVTRLRKLGLGAILVSRDDGFLFDPRIAWSLE